MGASYGCCIKSPKHDPGHTNNAPVDNHPLSVVITAQPTADTKPPVDITFPRYPALHTEGVKEPPISVVNSTAAMGQGDSSSIMNLYNRYVNREMGQISAEGIEQLCNDLDLSPEDFRVLVLAYSLGAQIMCRFTEEEFVSGCEKHGITDIETMSRAIPRLMDTVKGTSFPSFYQWTYRFALDVESGQRTLPTDMAISLWKLVFHQNYPLILDRWLSYIETETSVKGISKDTWDMFLIFVDQISDDLQSYDDTEAWPSLLDDFVEYELAKKS